jgi:predicted N-acetyltransferase YhbS
VDFTVEPLASHHDQAAFTCGDSSLDAYIQRQARQDIRRDLAACYVLCIPGGSQIIGYYTLSALAIEVTALPPEMAKTAGRYQLVPAVLLGRLAVDIRFAGQGMGSLLLYNAMRRVLRTGIGVKAIIVDALDERAARYYEQFDFKRFADNPLRLYLPLGKVRDIFPGEGAAPDTP